jgi:hypothetical protein
MGQPRHIERAPGTSGLPLTPNIVAARERDGSGLTWMARPAQQLEQLGEGCRRPPQGAKPGVLDDISAVV